MGMLLAVPVLAAGCADQPVINTGEPPTPPAPGSATPSTPTSNARLVNAFDYVGHVGEIPGYYFTTTRGKWRCALIAHTKAGCQAASGWQSGLGVEGEPDSTNAIVIDRDGDRSTSRWNNRSSGCSRARPTRCSSTGSSRQPESAATCRSPGFPA